jgi:(p)ppGpp synthase/HD superfamily hydrolase
MKLIFGFFIYLLITSNQGFSCQLFFEKNFPMTPEFSKAYELARILHHGQKRKITGLNYISHPESVTVTLWESVYKIEKRIITEEEKIAAILHDSIEDTNLTLIEIENLFGKKVADLVFELTSDKSKIQLMGKTAYLISKFNSISDTALTIKLADRLDNLSDLTHQNATNLKFVKDMVLQTDEILKSITRELLPTHKYLIIKIEEQITHIKILNCLT